MIAESVANQPDTSGTAVIDRGTTTEVWRGIREDRLNGLVLLTGEQQKKIGRLIYVDNYGGLSLWEKIKAGDMPPHHLRGSLELARMGYEVVLAEPIPDFYFNRRAVPHDLRLLPVIREWLGRDGILFCGHNVLYWLLLLRRTGVVKSRIVSHLWAREPLNFAASHSGIVALTRAGFEQAQRLAPRVPVAQLGWGADLSIYPTLPYRPDAFFSCGIAMRDFQTLSRAAAHADYRLSVVVPGQIEGVSWPSNVNVVDSGKGWSFDNKRLSYSQLLHEYYARSAASLIIVRNDPIEYHACGFTELIEALAMGRPVIMTRTGALPTQVDIEKAECGIFVPPEDPDALARAIKFLGSNPDVAEQMGRHARQLAESYYNIERYAKDLHTFFQSL